MRSSFIFGLILQITRPVFALGFDKTNVTDTVGFVREDNQRDTISLLLSCFATLGLCVYSAVHLNVPRKGENNIRVLIREFKWCIIGLFAPELILYTAWRQLASARQLRYEINSIGKVPLDGCTSNEKVCFSSLQGSLVSLLSLLGHRAD
jgi:hypothetical protein